MRLYVICVRRWRLASLRGSERRARRESIRVWVVRNKIELNTMANQFSRSGVSRVKAIGMSAVSAVALMMPLSASADWKMNLQAPNSAIAQQMFDLHTLITVVCVVIFFAVFGVMFYSLYAHRKSSGRKASQFHESATVEALWTIIPRPAHWLIC